ncbi:MAG: ABC transporter permease [Chloroflexi bacterium]|nr:ABC transporter permease [Chloroflexota bacterium]
MSTVTGWRLKLVFFAGLLLLWEGLVRLHLWPSYIFPSPLTVGQSLLNGIADGVIPLAILTSLRRLLLAYAISLLIGIPLGLLLGRTPLLQETLGTIVLGLQALPSICWLPLALLWFGLSETAITFVVVMGAVLSITLSTADGVRNTPPLYLRAARTMGARGWRLYTAVILPSTLPAILSGMKLGWSFAWRSLMAAELIYITTGLGQVLTLGRELNDMARVLSVMLVIISIGLLADYAVFRPAELRIRQRWGLHAGA